MKNVSCSLQDEHTMAVALPDACKVRQSLLGSGLGSVGWESTGWGFRPEIAAQAPQP